MYGIGAVKYKDFTIGYIEKNSFDLGGKKPEAAKIEAEQVQGAPVLVIPQSNGGIAPTFNVIQMNYSNLHKLLGGSLHYKKEDSEKKTPIGWSVDYILDGVNYQTLIMMLSDAPRYVRRKKGGGEGRRRTDRSAEDEADDIVGFFQSRLE